MVHLVRVPEVRDRVRLARACCGRAFGPGELELLDEVAGMPCEACLCDATGAHDEPDLAGGDAISTRLAGLEAAVDLLAKQVTLLRQLLARAIELMTGQDQSGTGRVGP